MGLIPAHAGKTLAFLLSLSCVRAHPRSRGENEYGRKKSRITDWLIPAHAGKTILLTERKVSAWAHPRSRGENSNDTT